jgi:MoxR-like ATPase
MKPVLRHRILPNFEADAEGMTPDRILDDVASYVDSRDKDPIRV